MGGHAEQLLDTAGGTSRLLGIDRDPEALARAARRLERFGARVVLVRGSFRHLRAIATDAGVERAAAVLLDLGVSSYQLDESGARILLPGRGAARHALRSGRGRHRRGRCSAACPPRRSRACSPSTARSGTPGASRACSWSSAAAARCDRRRSGLGGEACGAARRVVQAHPRGDPHLPGGAHGGQRRAGRARARRCRRPPRSSSAGGRLGVISFHSGEDRVVKRAFRSLEDRASWSSSPRRSPRPRGDRANPRARSAKLRVLARREAA